jgi:DNA-binding winged helix-turn-helix (wHTH) protein
MLAQQGPMLYQFDDYCLDVTRHELRRGNELVAIEPQVLDLLHYLIRNRERVVSKDDLIADVWKFALSAKFRKLLVQLSPVRRAKLSRRLWRCLIDRRSQSCRSPT